METTVSGQAIEAAAALGLGLAAGFVYDVLRVARRRAPLKLVTAVCDFIFCAAAGVALFFLGLTLGGGRARALLGVLAVLGGSLYFLTLSRPALYFLQGLADLMWLPAAFLIEISKKIANLIKKLFIFALGWYIFKERNVMTGARRHRRRLRREERDL
jgi:hypothetical protein